MEHDAPIDEIIEQWRRRQAWHRTEKSITLQAKALCRRLTGGDRTAADAVYRAALAGSDDELAALAFAAIHPLTEARATIERNRKTVERRLVRLARDLPVAAWAKETRGLGMLGLAGIVGEAGNLATYETHARLWKRLGLAVMSDGTRQRRIKGDAAIEHGYNAARRSLVWTIGTAIIKVGGPYREIYDARKALEAERVTTKGHAHNRAKRYMEKRLVRDLWRAWRQATPHPADRPKILVPAGARATPSEERIAP